MKCPNGCTYFDNIRLLFLVNMQLVETKDAHIDPITYCISDIITTYWLCPKCDHREWESVAFDYGRNSKYKEAMEEARARNKI
jgi:hypothetical protein